MASDKPPPSSNGHTDNEKQPDKESKPPSGGQQDASKGKEKEPAGGFDATPIPNTPTGYTLRITFHSATNLPMADYGARTSDPFLHARFLTSTPSRHKEDPPLTFRTQTRHRTVEPTWDASWVLANVPSSGFTLKVHVFDEDPDDHDDRLGSLHIHEHRIDEGYKGFDHRSFELKKRSASWRAYAIRWVAVGCGKKEMHAKVLISIENLGKTEAKDGRVHTVGPQRWSKHFSPLIGRLVKHEAEEEQTENSGTKRYNFEANQIQLRGPVPPELYHRYVEFKSFVKGMFSRAGLRGRTLHWVLHHQHNRIYNYDENTKDGVIEEPGEELSRQFLKMVHYDEGGRLFTYVITLDGLFRFTETGKEFGIDLLSKHTMHSDVAQYIACSGEFFIRRLHREAESKKPVDEQDAHAPNKVEGGPPKSPPPKDVSLYELVIDNDSGTYRPKGELMPELQKFLEGQFKGLKVRALTCDDEHLKEAKKQQNRTKQKEGEGLVYAQGSLSSSSSLSSSDVSDLEDRAEAAGRTVDEEDEAEHGGGPSALKRGLDAVKEPKQGFANWAAGQS